MTDTPTVSGCLERLARHLPGVLFQLRRHPGGEIDLPYAGAGIEAIFGCSPAQACDDAAAIFDAIHPEDRAGFFADLDASARDRQDWYGEYRVCHPAAGCLWFEMRGAPERLSDGSVRWLGYLNEITERKAREQNLVERERLYHSLFDNVSDAVFLVAVEGEDFRYRATNLAHQTATGLPDLVGNRPADVLDPETACQVTQNYAECRRQRTGLAYEETIELPGGRRIWATTLAPILDGRGQVELIAGISRDITEAKAMHDEIAMREQRLRALFDAIPDAVLLLDPNSGVATRFNATAPRQLGYDEEEFARLRVADYEVYETEAEIAAHIAEVHARGTDIFETKHRRKDGSTLDVQVSACMIDLDDRDGMLCVYRDISASKRLQQELQRSNAELEQFAYVVSHDLRQPLRMVATHAQLLERDLVGELAEKHGRYLAHIRDGALRMDEMLVALLTYSRVGRHGEPIRPVSSRGLVDEALRYLEPVIQEREACIEIDGAWPTLACSRNEGVRLFQNLIGNALKYCPANRRPQVHLQVRRCAEGWLFAIGDNGIGIDPTQRERLFKVFQRLHTRSEYEGTGIGLAVCRRIVERHGGRIWVESDGQDRGAIVRFVLPERGPDAGAGG
jgi:PAS domain S-box-containing protein